MARTKDRHIISEAVRTHDLWRTEDLGRNYHVLHTDYDEQLEIYYNSAGNVRMAEYIHYDTNLPGGPIVSQEKITQRKRERVLELINQKDVNQ